LGWKNGTTFRSYKYGYSILTIVLFGTCGRASRPLDDVHESAAVADGVARVRAQASRANRAAPRARARSACCEARLPSSLVRVVVPLHLYGRVERRHALNSRAHVRVVKSLGKEGERIVDASSQGGCAPRVVALRTFCFPPLRRRHSHGRHVRWCDRYARQGCDACHFVVRYAFRC